MDRSKITAYLEGEHQRKRRRLRIETKPGAATAGVVFSWVPDLEGGHGPYTLALEAGALPDGLAIVGNTVAGTPTVAGSFEFWLSVTDARADKHSTKLNVTVNAA